MLHVGAYTNWAISWVPGFSSSLCYSLMDYESPSWASVSLLRGEGCWQLQVSRIRRSRCGREQLCWWQEKRLAFFSPDFSLSDRQGALRGRCGRCDLTALLNELTNNLAKGSSVGSIMVRKAWRQECEVTLCPQKAEGSDCWHWAGFLVFIHGQTLASNCGSSYLEWIFSSP